MATGFILLGNMMKDLVPITAHLNRANPAHSMIFSTGVVSSGTVRVCGKPQLRRLQVTPSEARFQVVTYLYDLDLSSNVGRLITHGTSTVWDGDAGKLYTFPTIDFHTCCFDVAEGHAIALGITMYDHLYTPASTTASLSFTYGAAALDPPIASQAD